MSSIVFILNWSKGQYWYGLPISNSKWSQWREISGTKLNKTYKTSCTTETIGERNYSLKQVFLNCLFYSRDKKFVTSLFLTGNNNLMVQVVTGVVMGVWWGWIDDAEQNRTNIQIRPRNQTLTWWSFLWLHPVDSDEGMDHKM